MAYLGFIKRAAMGRSTKAQVYKNCNPGLALRVYQMTYTNSFEEDRFLSTMSREAEAFKKLIDDRSVSLLAHCRLRSSIQFAGADCRPW